MARTLPLMLSYYHLQAPFVNESYTQSSCRKTCGILLSCQESKTKTRALCLLCANTLHAKCQSLTTFIVTSRSREHSTRPCSLRSSILETKSNSFAVKNALGYPIPPHIAVRSYPSNCPNSSSDSGARSTTNRRISLKTLTFYKSSSMIPSLLINQIEKGIFPVNAVPCPLRAMTSPWALHYLQ